MLYAMRLRQKEAKCGEHRREDFICLRGADLL